MHTHTYTHAGMDLIHSYLPDDKTETRQAMSRSQPVCLQIYSSSLGSDLTERQRETHTHTEEREREEEGGEKVERSKEGTGEEEEETENFS